MPASDYMGMWAIRHPTKSLMRETLSPEVYGPLGAWSRLEPKTSILYDNEVAAEGRFRQFIRDKIAEGYTAVRLKIIVVEELDEPPNY